MFRLTLLLFVVIGASLAGMFIVAGLTKTQPVAIAAAAGFALGQLVRRAADRLTPSDSPLS